MSIMGNEGLERGRTRYSNAQCEAAYAESYGYEQCTLEAGHAGDHINKNKNAWSAKNAENAHPTDLCTDCGHELEAHFINGPGGACDEISCDCLKFHKSLKKNAGPTAQESWDLASRGERDAQLREMNVPMSEKYRGLSFADLPSDVQKKFTEQMRDIFGNAGLERGRKMFSNTKQFKVGDRVRMTKSHQDRSMWRGEDMTFVVIDEYSSGNYDYQIQSQEKDKGSAQVKEDQIERANGRENANTMTSQELQTKWDAADLNERREWLKEVGSYNTPDSNFSTLPRGTVKMLKKLFGVLENARPFDAKKLAEPRPCPHCGDAVVLVDTTTGLCKSCFDDASASGELDYPHERDE